MKQLWTCGAIATATVFLVTPRRIRSRRRHKDELLPEFNCRQGRNFPLFMEKVLHVNRKGRSGLLFTVARELRRGSQFNIFIII